ncbi:serine/threonine-protein kinase [Paeniglutamicibacter psychrophenolicus]|uniref:serine/threonine-protein kinase n=1 Tax=Paeniglutamicibacter psychrophenolicus TaxID=257454 RepID=UPI00277DED1C|nr:serine/threonine-protein kinase [Paeniglutamicibacter psychrophenolicus]MDQ0093803.1 serine/threonine-protein kinase [Paeniglutamicibacter psychrophenolicus]
MANVQPGDALGASYRFIEPIGSGAVGEVWRVGALSGGVDLAAKVLRPEHAHDPALVERFVKERSVLLGLRHPNIVAVRDLVVEGERLAILMDLVAGGSLRDLLEERHTLPAADALVLCAEVLDALAYAHTRNTAHRDIKPDNVLLAEPWKPGLASAVRVSDFGIASVVHERARHTTGLVGTPAYMPPELLSSGEVGPAADLYATGIMLYELLAGRTPFAGTGTDFTLAYRHVTTMPPRLAVPEAVWEALESLLDKDPRQRPGAPEAAALLRRLSARFADLSALPVATGPEAFEPLQRPATVLRGAAAQPEPGAQAGPGIGVPNSEIPDLGPAGQHTVVRSMPRPEQRPRPQSAPAPRSSGRRPAWLTGKAIALIAAGLVAASAIVVGAVALAGPDAPAAAPAPDATASQQDAPLPSGLSVSRSAQYDAQAKEVRLTITYAAQKAPLAGPFLEVLPGAAGSAACPPATWEKIEVTRNQPSLTGISEACGWSLSGIAVPAKGSVEASARIPVELTGEDALGKWLQGAAAATTAAVSDPEAGGSEYPVQRLRDILVTTPARTVSQTALPVTLVPVWPGGPDVLNPLYASPSTGKASAMLAAVAGGEEGVRFSDGCSGSLAVSADGLVVTALSVSPSCILRAGVGNFTDLASDPFSITTRE